MRPTEVGFHSKSYLVLKSDNFKKKLVLALKRRACFLSDFEYFAKMPGKIMSKSFIWYHIWKDWALGKANWKSVLNFTALEMVILFLSNKDVLDIGW